MPKAKPYSGPIEEDVARQLLNSTGCAVEINGASLLLGDALLAAAKQLKELVYEANRQLDNSDFVKIIAGHLAADMNRRGSADIAVSDSGAVLLHVNHKGNPRNPKPKIKRERKLPLMTELKNRADSLGVDIPEEFGIKRSKIVEYLDQVEKGESVPPNTILQKTQVKKVEIAEDSLELDPGPMSAGPDEIKVSAPLDDVNLPKKRGFVKTGEAVRSPVVVSTELKEDLVLLSETEGKVSQKSPEGAFRAPVRSMRKLVEESKDVSITDLLASEPPK